MTGKKYVIFGAEYKNASGDVVTLQGLGARSVVIQKKGEYERTPADDFFNEYTLTDKHDHENFCCDVHDSHTSPHKGCLLR